MNTQQFIQEVLESGKKPENFQEDYKKFREYQDLAAQTLRAFGDACRKNRVPFQLSYGSLLGAVRDGGQIPWDYDIDVFVPYGCKDRLLQALEKDLDPDYYYYCPEKDLRCRHFFVRVAPNGYASEALHVDVFYLVGAPEDPEERQTFARRLAELSRRRFSRLVRPFQEANTPRRAARLLFDRVKLLTMSLKKEQAEFDSLCCQHDWETAPYFVTGDVFAADMSFRAEPLRHLTDMDTEIGTFPVPQDYEDELVTIYGDWHGVPALEDRLREIAVNLQMLNRRAKIR